MAPAKVNCPTTTQTIYWPPPLLALLSSSNHSTNLASTMSEPHVLSLGESGAKQGTFQLELGSTKTVIRINAIPAISASPLAKSIAYNSLTTALYHHRHSLTPADCINALIMNIPVPAASAESEANRYANMSWDQFLQVTKITPKAFLTKSGRICTANPLHVIAGHIPHIRFALVKSSINPSKLCHLIMGHHNFTDVFATALQSTLPNARLEFCLHLPQDAINPFTTTTDADSDDNCDSDINTGNNPAQHHSHLPQTHQSTSSPLY